MRRFLSGLFAAALLLFPPGALAALGTPTALGTGAGLASGSGAANLTITVGATGANAGDLVFVGAGVNNTNGPTGCSDSVGGNTWNTLANKTPGASAQIGGCWSILTNALPTSSTITVTYATNSGNRVAAAVMVSGADQANPLDVYANGTSATSATVTAPATGTRAQPNEMVCMWNRTSSASSETWSNDAALTPIPATNANSGAASTILKLDCTVVSTTTTATYAGSWPTSHLYEANVISFKEAGGAVCGARALSGVGC